MDRTLDTLDPYFREMVCEFLARTVEARIPIVIVNTLRTALEQAHAVKTGKSWVTHSKHQDGCAIDIAPYGLYMLHGEDKLNWDAKDPIWTRLGVMGELAGMEWGGRWRQRDMGHFELKSK